MFVTLEGGDGSGKSTLASMLLDYVNNHYGQAILTRQPNGKFREFILNSSLVPEAECLLFYAERIQQSKNFLKPTLDKNIIIISDRYMDSSYAYQVYGKFVDPSLVETLNKFIVIPDLTFFLDIEPEKALARTTDPNKFEALGLNFHKRVYKGYKALANTSDRIITIDANRSLEEVFDDICLYFDKKFIELNPLQFNT